MPITSDTLELAWRYPITPGTGHHYHAERDDDCAVHCTCRDHYYRARECKHLAAWLELWDALAFWKGARRDA